MMCFRAYDGKVALWEKPASGDPMAPFDNPYDHLDKVKFHSDLQFLANNLIQLGVTVNHASVAGVTGTGYSTSAEASSSGTSTPIANGQVVTASYDLLTHDLGYVPLFFVVHNGSVISAGMPVQTQTARLRTVSAFATTTKIRLRDIGISSTAALAAISLDYDVYVFKDPVGDPLLPLYHVKVRDPGARIVLGHGKVSGDQSVVRRADPGDSPVLNAPMSRTVDSRNGALRFLRSDGSSADIGTYTGMLNAMDYVPLTFDDV